jgi:putative ABC transport system permease protein
MSDMWSRMVNRLSRMVSALRLVAGTRHLFDEERQMDDEMRFHVDMHTEKNVAAGMAPDMARRAAVLAFGGASRWKEDARDEIRSRPLDDFVRDVAYGMRALRRDP